MVGEILVQRKLLFRIRTQGLLTLSATLRKIKLGVFMTNYVFYMWSLILFLTREFGLPIDELPYVEIDKVKFSCAKINGEFFLFIDVTDNVQLPPTPEIVFHICKRMEVPFNKEYIKIYNDFLVKRALNPKHTLEDELLGR